MTGKELEEILRKVPEHQSLRVKILREARQATGERFPIITDRRLKRRMFDELEHDMSVCEKITAKLKTLHPIALDEADHQDILSIFL
jgi:hypothetical protein